MYEPTIIATDTPRKVTTLVRRVYDLHLQDVHAMLRLPRPEANIAEGCNFAICAVLMNIIGGASVVLYEPPPNRQETGRKFKDVVSDFYPWDTEPATGVTAPDEGAEVLYTVFRNPIVHALGFQDPEPPGPVNITRLGPLGLSEDSLREIERATTRPVRVLAGAPTLLRDPSTAALQLNVEALYWGVREQLRRLTCDFARMAEAERHLPELRKQT